MSLGRQVLGRGDADAEYESNRVPCCPRFIWPNTEQRIVYRSFMMI
jgi:hypothetical protein